MEDWEQESDDYVADSFSIDPSTSLDRLGGRLCDILDFPGDDDDEPRRSGGCRLGNSSLLGRVLLFRV